MRLLKQKTPKRVKVDKMAYLRKDKETFEISYSLEKVWAAVRKTLNSLDWEVEEIDDATHRAKAKTRAGFISWGSTLLIEAVAVNEDTARVKVAAETPVTTITALVDFGRSRDRVELFFEELSKQLTN